MSDTLVTADLGPAPEPIIARDLARRAAYVAPVLVVVGALVAGVDGAASVAIGVALVLANLTAAAVSLAWAARISLGLVMGVATFGFLLRLAVLTGIVFAIRDLSFIDLATLGVTLIVTHLGLLAWELRYVSATLAHPALVPSASSTTLKENNR